MNNFDKWWGNQTLKGDPKRNPRLVKDAYEAGYQAGLREAEKDAKDAAAEGMWQERMGDDYGSY